MGTRHGAGKGTDVELKTWESRIHVLRLFSNFVGRTICQPADGPRPTDGLDALNAAADAL